MRMAMASVWRLAARLSLGNQLVVTVNATTAVGTVMQTTVYQFNFDVMTGTGTFTSSTQKGAQWFFLYHRFSLRNRCSAFFM